MSDGDDSTFVASFSVDDGDAKYKQKNKGVRVETVEHESDDDVVEEEVIEEVFEDELIEDEVIEDEIIEDEIIEDEVIEDEIIEDEVLEDEVIEDMGAVVDASPSSDLEEGSRPSKSSSKKSKKSSKSNRSKSSKGSKSARSSSKNLVHSSGHQNVANSRLSEQRKTSSSNVANQARSQDPIANQPASLPPAILHDGYDYEAWMYPGYNTDKPMPKTSIVSEPEDPPEDHVPDEEAPSQVDWGTWAMPPVRDLESENTAIVMRYTVPNWADWTPGQVDYRDEDESGADFDESPDTYTIGLHGQPKAPLGKRRGSNRSTTSSGSAVSSAGTPEPSRWFSDINFGDDPPPEQRRRKKQSDVRPQQRQRDKSRSQPVMFPEIPPYRPKGPPKVDDIEESSQGGSDMHARNHDPQKIGGESEFLDEGSGTTESFEEEFSYYSFTGDWVPSNWQLLLLSGFVSLILGLIGAVIYYGVREKSENENDNIFNPP